MYEMDDFRHARGRAAPCFTSSYAMPLNKDFSEAGNDIAEICDYLAGVEYRINQHLMHPPIQYRRVKLITIEKNDEDFLQMEFMNAFSFLSKRIGCRQLYMLFKHHERRFQIHYRLNRAKPNVDFYYQAIKQIFLIVYDMRINLSDVNKIEHFLNQYT